MNGRLFNYSLLHATFRAGPTALATRAQWIDRSHFPHRVEHLFSLDEDDLPSVLHTRAFRCIVNPAMPGRVTAVRNWNSAARAAIGEILLVVADDLTPSDGWDLLLDVLLDGFDPSAQAFVVKIRDDPRPKDSLLRHPIVSQLYFNQFGLFDDRYSGLYADTDFTIRAFRNSIILDGRSILFDHLHAGQRQLGITPLSTSQQAINHPSEHSAGQALFRQFWSRRLRLRPVRLVATTRLRHRSPTIWRAVRYQQLLVANLFYLKATFSRFASVRRAR